MTDEYQNDAIVVLWDAERCVRSGNCLRGMPAVFDPAASPWIRLQDADPRRVAEVVIDCPSGALHFRRLDGREDEVPSAPTAIQAVRNGPLYVRGDIEVTAADNTLLRRDTRMALCRCGGSDNKPFCDNSHRTNGFQSGEAGQPSA